MYEYYRYSVIASASRRNFLQRKGNCNEQNEIRNMHLKTKEEEQSFYFQNRSTGFLKMYFTIFLTEYYFCCLDAVVNVV